MSTYFLDMYRIEREGPFKRVFYKTGTYASAMQIARRRRADALRKGVADKTDWWTLSDEEGIIYHSVLGRIRENIE